MRNRRLFIDDPEALSDAIRSLVERYGGQAETARQTGLQQSQISRLVGRQLSEIGLRQFEKLARHFDKDMRAQLEKALFSPAARDALRRYNRWLAEVRDHAAASTERRSRKELFERVQALPGVYGSFVQHINELGLSGDRPRIAVALLRTLEPLLVSRQTGGIERDWRELNDTELRRFVEFGLRRELILLTRADSEVRAQISNSANTSRASKRRKRRAHGGHGGHDPR